ncbi:membrane bound O-acyl transferase family-domain-containing protein [Paraphysoderma sedebokerense]|nr:membrane bound O-acyl transferase family-domain-containing protein [Paraphysoderma sedebokerense]
MSTVGPNIPSFIVRSVLATLLAYTLVNTPSSILDTSFYSVRSFKTNFLLVNMIWLFGTVGWDLASLSVRSLVAVGTSLHQSSFPESDILIANPKEHTVAFYVQDALAFITNYIPMFGNIYTLKSVGDLWGRLWHQNFKSVFSDLVYYKLTDPRKKSVRQTLIAVSATFLVSGLLHDYMIATASGLEAAKFEHTLFFLIQPFFLVAETMFFSSRISKQRIPRFLFLCLELYINGGLLSLFVRHFLRYDTHKSMAYPFTVVDWKRLDSQGILLSSIQTWLTSDSIFQF